MKTNIKILIVLFLLSFFMLSHPYEMSNSEAVTAVVQQPFEPKIYALEIARSDYGWNKYQFACLASLWGKESAWNHLADNPESTAFGIAQMLGETSKDPKVQIEKGLRYVEHRYETPCKAWAFWKRNNYY